MSVNARMKMNIPKIMDTGIAILNDFDRTIYKDMPAIKQNNAVLVPDAKNAHIAQTPEIKKKILSFFIFDVIEKTINAAAEEAIVQPKHAASLNIEKYLIIPLT